MATQKIKCGACGFGALLFTTGESTKVTVDSAKQSHLCNYFRQQAKSSTVRLGALDCPDFREAVDRPTKVGNSGSPPLDKTENEPEVAKEAAPEKARTKGPARPRRSRRAEVAEAEAEAGSPKAKAVGRAPRKGTVRRKIDSDVPLVPDREPMVS
jgi:hypothetical protein